MLKLTFVPIFSLTLFLMPNLVSSNQENAEPLPEIESVNFDKGPIAICPFNSLSCREGGDKVNVSTTVKNNNDKDLIYYYFVTGGKIIGQGANVTWDFEGVKPDKTYEITVGIGKDNVLFGKTITKTLELQECGCDKPCECPDISISGPTKPVAAGNSVIFKVETLWDKKQDLTHKWSVSGGTIITSADRQYIIVKTTPEMAGKTLTATVEIGGLCPQCPPTESKTISFRKN